ncbi:MAG: SEC-C domain-containing protein [Polyangiaceae bacterium]|nr:SEC-C domain-containing protein [Polyangiaceae bacterium]
MAALDRETPEGRLAAHRDLGARIVVAMGKRIGAPILRYEKPEDVPAGLALTMAVNQDFCYLERAPNNANVIIWLFTMIPWIARAAPEDLYLPRDVLRAMHVPWRPDHTLTILRAMRDHEGPRNSAPVREGPARKGPCPCGSGKEYKRCCGQGKGAEGDED